MALLTFLPEAKEPKTTPSSKRMKKQQKQKKQNEPSSWDQVKNILSCTQIEGSKVIDPSKSTPQHHGSNSKLGSSCSSIYRFRDVVNGNTRVVHRADNSPESSSLGQETRLLTRKAVSGSSSSRSLSARSSGGGSGSGGSGGSHTSSRAMQFRRLSGCYECHMIVDPSRYLASRTTICACSLCGEVFSKIESLELHQAVRHAVSELGPEDSGRNIVEIIFKSSWLKKDNPICQIERILKVHNSQCTIQLFEDCRDAVKARALNSTKKHPRCAADGNELLRFYCTTLSCSLGSKGSSSLCGSIPGCGVCTIIRHGFQGKGGAASTPAGFKGVRTTASSGRAHDSLMKRTDERRAMIVCRVIAGRVKRVADDAATEEENVVSAGSYDSVAAYTNAGVYSNLEELIVFNPRAILPCFVVIYKALES